MLQIKNNRLFYNTGDKVHGYELRIAVGYSKEECLELEKQFRAAGFETRVAQHGETKEWSVAIIG